MYWRENSRISDKNQWKSYNWVYIGDLSIRANNWSHILSTNHCVDLHKWIGSSPVSLCKQKHNYSNMMNLIKSVENKFTQSRFDKHLEMTNKNYHHLNHIDFPRNLNFIKNHTKDRTKSKSDDK